MRPERTGDCDHPDDEWCDVCFLPTRSWAALRELDREARTADVDERLDATPETGRQLMTPERIAEWRSILNGAGLDDPPTITSPSEGMARALAGEGRQLDPNPREIVIDVRGIDPAAALERYRAAVRRDPFPRVLDDGKARAQAEADMRAAGLIPPPCVNRRHPDHKHGWKTSCGKPVPPYGYAHRITGAAALGLVVAAGAGFVLTVRALEHAHHATQVARMRWDAAWARRLG